MNNSRKWILLAVVGACFTQARSGQSASIVNTKHDMSTKPWNTTNTLCGVCHTPHNGKVGQPVLWNHTVTTATFAVYSSPTMNAATGGQPSGTSKLCLSCHDGTVALENFGTVTTGTNYVTGTARLGSDLSNDHPVSITYNTALSTADPGLYDPATKAWNGPTLPASTIASQMLFANVMECASCHDVHDNAWGKFLRKNNNGSQLCLTCHNK